MQYTLSGSSDRYADFEYADDSGNPEVHRPSRIAGITEEELAEVFHRRVGLMFLPTTRPVGHADRVSLVRVVHTLLDALTARGETIADISFSRMIESVRGPGFASVDYFWPGPGHPLVLFVSGTERAEERVAEALAREIRTRTPLSRALRRCTTTAHPDIHGVCVRNFGDTAFIRLLPFMAAMQYVHRKAIDARVDCRHVEPPQPTDLLFRALDRRGITYAAFHDAVLRTITYLQDLSSASSSEICPIYEPLFDEPPRGSTLPQPRAGVSLLSVTPRMVQELLRLQTPVSIEQAASHLREAAQAISSPATSEARSTQAVSGPPRLPLDTPGEPRLSDLSLDDQIWGLYTAAGPDRFAKALVRSGVAKILQGFLLQQSEEEESIARPKFPLRVLEV